VWLAVQEPEKTFLQGLIQIAAAFYHLQRGNCAGTVSLLQSALRRLDRYPERRSLRELWLGHFVWPSVHGSKPSKQLLSLRRHQFRSFN